MAERERDEGGSGGERQDSLGSVPNAHPSHLELWLVRLRDRLRERIFSTTRGEPEPGSTEALESVADVQELPRTIGRYEVLSRIGSGGMGFIVAALDPTLGRKVAVKLLHPAETPHGEQGQARLLREAQALAKLSHPGVIHVYEVGTHADRVFVAMEFVEGTTLRRWQSDPERTWRSVLAAYIQAGEGLAAAHRVGIVHRDFKPDNVLVRNHDRAVRVIDFGLARTEVEDVPLEPTRPLLEEVSSQDALTRSGTVMGTPAYMAPEQFNGRPADARTDQFSFCVALYEALYGYRPFAAVTAYQLATAVLEGKVEPPPRYTDVPERVYRVLLRGLCVDPGRRFATMDDLLAELPSESPRVLRWVAGSVAGLALIGVGSMWAWSDREDARRAEIVRRLEAEFSVHRVAEAEKRLRESHVRSAEQRWNEVVLAAAVKRVEAEPTVALGLLERIDASVPGWLSPARLVAAQAVARPFVMRHLRAPHVVEHLCVSDGGQVMAWASSADPRIHRVRMHGQAEVMPELPAAVTSMTMSPDGQTLVGGDAKGHVTAWTIAGARMLPRHRAAVTSLAVSADGRTICSGSKDGTIRVWTQGTVETLELGAELRAVALSPSGATVAAATADGLVRARETTSGSRWMVLHRFARPLRKLQFVGAQSLLGLDGDGRAWRVQVDEHDTRHLDSLGRVQDLAHGERTMTMVVADSEGTLRLFDGAESRDLGPASASAVAMSSDGRFVAVAHSNQDVELWSVEAPEPMRRRVRDGALLGLAYSKASGRLATGTSSGAVRVWQMDEHTETALGHLVGGARHLSFAPDGDALAALGGSGGLTIWSLTDDQGPQTLSPASSMEPPLRWSEDGTAIMSQVCDAPQRCAVVSYRVDDGKSLVTSRLGPTIRMIGPSSDGRRVLALRRRRTVELFEQGSYEPRRLTWTHGFPGSVMAMRWDEATEVVRLATHDAETLTLWDWDARADVLVPLDSRDAEVVLSDPAGESLLVRAGSGDELWLLRESLPRPLYGVPAGVEAFELDWDQQLAALYTRDSVTILHVPTGTPRTLGELGGSLAWRGGSSFVQVDERAIIFHEDPTPSGREAFMSWLSAATDATAELGD